MNLVEKLFYIPEFILGFRHGDPHKNGEYKFLKTYLKDKMTILDVGANLGEYTEYLFNLKNDITVHCFEPVEEIFIQLQEKIKQRKLNSEVKLNNIGIGDKIEQKEFFIYGSLAGSNSFYLRDIITNAGNEVTKRTINIITLDEYIQKNNLGFVDFIKIDVEGYEPEVIFGASNSFKLGIINCIQFEYGGTWQNSNYKLTDVLQFLYNNNFRIFRLTPWGKIRINNIVNNLNSLKYSNYIAIKK